MDDTTKTNTGSRFTVRRLVPLAVLAAALGAAFLFDVHRLLSFETLAENRETLQHWRVANPAVASAAFIAAYAAAVAVSLPGAIWMTIFAGFLFGTALGAVHVVIGATAGATVVFLAARYAFADYFRPRVAAWMPRFEAGFQANAGSYLLVLRLVPLFPFWLVNLAPAFLGVPARLFVVTTALGIVPGTVVYSGLGNGIGHVIEAGGTPDLGVIFEPQVFLPLIALAALSLVPVAYKRLRRDREPVNR